MSVFTSIDIRLDCFAAEHRAVFTKNRNSISTNLFKFEERRIDWKRDGMSLAVIIQPDFNVNGVDISKWNFRAVVWKDNGPNRFALDKLLAKSVNFRQIEMHLEKLLHESNLYLINIEVEDLKLIY